MPIEVITGQPGNGKTLLMMERLHEEAAKQGRRVLVACGIDGLAPGLVDIELPSAKVWNDRDADGKHIIPDGALIFCDEAWKDFGHLHDARQAPTPAHVLALAEHRHRGLDFVWTTQQPNQLYPFVRGLIGAHHHVARKFGTKVTEIYSWGELVEDVKSQGMRDKALSRVWLHPKHLFDKYKSATQHTIKGKLPWRVILLPLLVIAALAALYFGVQLLRPSTMTARLHGQQAGAGGSAAASAAPKVAQKTMPKTAAEWATALTPTLPGIAYTAPIYADTLQLNGHPQTLCVISGEPSNDVCHCYTEQVTPVDVPDGICRRIANKRYYDPFRPDGDSKHQGEERTRRAPDAEEMATLEAAEPGAAARAARSFEVVP